MPDDALLFLFKNNPLLKTLNSTEIQALFLNGRKIALRAGESLIREGDAAEEFFFVLKGTLEASRQDSASKQSQTIAFFNPGDILGEMALIDKEPRSANVSALTEAELLAIPFKSWNINQTDSAIFYKILFGLAQNLSAKLRSSNVKNLERQVDFYKNRILFGHIFISIIFLISFVFFLQRITEFLQLQSIVPYVTIPISSSIVIIMAYLVKKFHLSWKTFGITKIKWKESLFDATLFTIPILAGAVAIKWGLIYTNLISEKTLFSGTISWLPTIIYALIITPMQELTTRGGLQSMLMQFLEGKHKKWSAIGISSLIFSATHLVISLYLSLASLFLSFYCGWLYSRTQNLIGVWFAHTIIGVFALDLISF